LPAKNGGVGVVRANDQNHELPSSPTRLVISIQEHSPALTGTPACVAVYRKIVRLEMLKPLSSTWSPTNVPADWEYDAIGVPGSPTSSA